MCMMPFRLALMLSELKWYEQIHDGVQGDTGGLLRWTNISIKDKRMYQSLR